MAKHLKLNIKNTQIAEAINLGGLKQKLAKKKEAEAPAAEKPTPKAAATKAKKEEAEPIVKAVAEDAPRARARSKSVFAESPMGKNRPDIEQPLEEVLAAEVQVEPEIVEEKPVQKISAKKSSEELRRDIFGAEAVEEQALQAEKPSNVFGEMEAEIPAPVPQSIEEPVKPSVAVPEQKVAPVKPEPVPFQQPAKYEGKKTEYSNMQGFKMPVKAHDQRTAPPVSLPKQKLGPTGRHISDLIPPKRPPQPEPVKVQEKAPEKAREKPKEKPSAKPVSTRPVSRPGPGRTASGEATEKQRGKVKPREFAQADDSKVGKAAPSKEFRDIKPTRKGAEGQRTFDARDRHGLRDSDEDQRWRKKRGKQVRYHEDLTIRPTTLKVRLPISIKDLAVEMKLKASELIAKLFLQGVVVTLNDLLNDETTVQLLGHEFGCEISIDSTEEQRIRITDKTVREEIAAQPEEQLITRAPVIAFMGHVDHGKTSLIDSIRKSNRAAGEAGAITQHIGAFRCDTAVGPITILDTPGHEAFSAMRARGADVTDIVVLVVAGDEGIRQQTIEAIEHARKANVTIVVAINKADKPNFNPETVYRQLSEQNLLPEVWGGQTLTVNCSAVTGAGIKELLETLALQSEVMELKANPSMRARGVVLESEMHKGMGSVATILVQNGTLRLGDAVVFEQHWGNIKTMRNEFGEPISEAPPSTPVEITGLSALPEAGQEFIVVKNEREAREISEMRVQGHRQSSLQQKKVLTLENLVQQATPTTKKVLNVILRADVQGSLEALRVALEKIQSTKAEVNIISSGVGEVSESDIQLGATSKALVLGFHTRIESHAEPMVKQLKVQVRMHDIIYHAVDDVKAILKGLLDKISQETERGKAEVKAIFKSSQVGLIAGCQVIEGSIQRNLMVRVVRAGAVIGKSPIASLKRVKEDVREVAKGLECGISLSKFSDLQVGDILEAYEITYLTQEL